MRRLLHFRRGHNGWITAISAPLDPTSDKLISASRDKTVIVWNLTREEGDYGFPVRALRGHSHFVQDVVISSDGMFALSGSWDGTLRLWDLATGQTARRFVDHKKVRGEGFPERNRPILQCKITLSGMLSSRRSVARFPTCRLPSGPAGCPLRRLLRGQQADRVRLPRQDHQALEHPGRVQVHDRPRGRGPLRLGLVRPLLPHPRDAHYR